MSIWLIAATSFVLFLSTQVGVPVLPALAVQLGADTQAMAAILSAALMTLVLLQFCSGVLVDRYGRRRVLVAGALLGSLSSLLCALATRWQWLLLWRILGGAADAIVMPALLGLTAEISQGQHGSFFGILRSSQGLSFILAPTLGGWTSLLGLRAPFVLDAIFSLLACVILGVGIRDPSPPIRPSNQPWPELKGLFLDKRVHAFFLFGAVNNFAFPILSSFVPAKAQLLRVAPWQIGLLLAAEATTYTLSAYLAGKYSDRWGRRGFVIVAQPLILLSCLGLALARSLVSLSVFYALFGLGSSMTFLMSSVMMADITPTERYATTLGAFDAAIDLILFAAPAIALALYSPLGQIEPLLVLAGAPALVALPVAWRVNETKPLVVRC